MADEAGLRIIALPEHNPLELHADPFVAAPAGQQLILNCRCGLSSVFPIVSPLILLVGAMRTHWREAHPDEPLMPSLGIVDEVREIRDVDMSSGARDK